MRRQLLPCSLLAFSLLTISCKSGQQQTSGTIDIDITGGMEKLTDLKVSDLGKTIQYLPLETTDSCLIGNNPEIKILEKGLLVYTGKQCMLFDKQTGKFIRSIGHKGNDPEAYSNTYPYINNKNKLIYFCREPNQLVKYDLNGNYVGTLTIPTPGTGSENLKGNFPTINSYTFSDSIITGHYVSGMGQRCPGLIRFSESGQFVDTIANIIPELGTGVIDDIESFSIRKGFGLLGGFILIEYKNRNQSISCPNNASLWENNGEIRYKELFTDTIYTIQGNKLEAYTTFHTGKYHWPADKRTQKDNNDERILISYAKENNDLIYFQFVKGIYTDQHTLYNGIYNKQSGTTTISEAEKAFTDDLIHFMPFTPTYMSEEGEYASLVQASDILTWIDEHPEKTTESTKELKKLNEESNPVVVLVQ